MKGYGRFRSQSQQKCVSGCWADNVEREFWHSRGRADAACMASPTSSTFSEVLPLMLARLFQFGSVKCQRHFVMVVVLKRQISAVVWDSVQASELP